MKNFSKELLFFIILTTMSTFSCTEQKQEGENITLKESEFANPEFSTNMFEDFGTQHNLFLQYATENYNNDEYTCEGFINFSYDYFINSNVIGINVNEEIESSEPFLISSFCSMESSGLFNNPVKVFEQKWLNNQFIIDSAVSVREKEYLEDLITILEDDYSGNSYEETISIIQTSIENLITEFHAENWDSEKNEGVVAGGLLYLARGSCQFWNANPIGGGSADVVVLQIDCLGYLWAWVDAVHDDFHSPGGCTPDGQWRRIQKGFIGGAAASSVAWWFS